MNFRFENESSVDTKLKVGSVKNYLKRLADIFDVAAILEKKVKTLTPAFEGQKNFIFWLSQSESLSRE